MTAEKWTINDFIESLEPKNCFSVKIVHLTTLCLIPAGVTLFINAQVASSLQCQWKLTLFQLTCITVAFLFGEGLGASYWGRMSDIYGRKKTLILSTFMVIYFTMMSSASQSYVYYVILRFLTGTFYGSIICINVVLLTEFTRSSDR